MKESAKNDAAESFRSKLILEKLESSNQIQHVDQKNG